MGRLLKRIAKSILVMCFFQFLRNKGGWGLGRVELGVAVVRYEVNLINYIFSLLEKMRRKYLEKLFEKFHPSPDLSPPLTGTNRPYCVRLGVVGQPAAISRVYLSQK